MSSDHRTDRTSTPAPESLPMLAFSSSVSAKSRAERRHHRLTWLSTAAAYVVLLLSIAQAGVCGTPRVGDFDAPHAVAGDAPGAQLTA